MAKELLVNVTFSEKRIALMDNGEILDYLVERSAEDTNTILVGNIYKGKVIRVLPGMQSAFVDIGYEKAAFLYVDDAYIPTLEQQREIAEKTKIAREHEIKMGELIPDELSSLQETVDMKYYPDIKIEDILKEGDEILVQIAKEPISTKGPRVTRHITFAGRNIVFMPLIEHTGVSRRIESEEERDRLKEILDSVRSEGVGVIARTVAEGQSYKVLKSDYNMLVKIWKDVQAKLATAKAPSEIYRDLDFIQRTLRDIMDEDVLSIIVDHKPTMKQIEKFMQKYMQGVETSITYYEEEIPIFDKYAVDDEIEKALSNKVYLKSGGSINVDQTEALVSIDVNTGKFVGKKSLEDTILKNNLEAVNEIAYQLRLRNCGGIIIIDFVDMDKEENREQVFKALLEALKKDRAKTNVLPISGLGLVEMTRKRTRDTLTRIMCHTCPYCEGTGKVKTADTVCYELVREITKIVKKTSQPKISVFAHPEVAAKLTSEDNKINFIDELEKEYNKVISVRAENNYHIEQYEIFWPNIVD